MVVCRSGSSQRVPRVYAGAIDAALALRRSTIYSGLGALGIVAFAGLENALSSLVESRLGFPSFIGPLIAGAMVAAVLIPIQRRVSGAVARRIGTVEVDGEPSPNTAPVSPRMG